MGMSTLTPLEILTVLMNRHLENNKDDAAAELAKFMTPYVHGKAPSGRVSRDLAGVSDDELERWERGGGEAAAAKHPGEPG